MRNTFFIFLISFFTYSSTLAQEKLTSFVNPLMVIGAPGNVSPGAAAPYGKLLIIPNNGRSSTSKTSRYHYNSDKIVGFSYGYLGENFNFRIGISIMPLVAPLKGQDTIFNAATFDHRRESAIPGYYSVELNNGIRVESTVSQLVGYQRFAFPAGSEPTIRFNLADQNNGDGTYETFIQKENDSTIVGYRYTSGSDDSQKLYFAGRTSKRFLEFRLKGELDIEAGNINIGLKSENRREGVTSQLIFNPISIQETIELKLAVSASSSEDALNNLNQIPHWNFNSVRAQANTYWEDELGSIRITSSDERLKQIFYTALYHTAIAPHPISSDRAGTVLPSLALTNDSTTLAIFPVIDDRQRARQHLDSLFQGKLDGYFGDAGTSSKSEWVVWNILGFNKVNRTRGEYHIGVPMIDRAIINLKNSNQFEIEVLNNSPQNKYVRSLKLNGANYKKDYLLHSDLIKGGKLTVNLGPEPTMKRDEAKKNIPTGVSKDIFKTISDFFKNLF